MAAAQAAGFAPQAPAGYNVILFLAYCIIDKTAFLSARPVEHANESWKVIPNFFLISDGTNLALADGHVAMVASEAFNWSNLCSSKLS